MWSDVIIEYSFGELLLGPGGLESGIISWLGGRKDGCLLGDTLRGYEEKVRNVPKPHPGADCKCGLSCKCTPGTCSCAPGKCGESKTQLVQVHVCFSPVRAKTILTVYIGNLFSSLYW